MAKKYTAAVGLHPPLLFRLRRGRAGIASLLAGVVIVASVLALRPGQVGSPGRIPAPSHQPEHLVLPRAAMLPSDEIASGEALLSFTARVKRDPEDVRSQNALAALYLQRVRTTGREDDLLPALEAARASLAAVPAERNLAGLTVLAQAEFANHNFAAARDHARRLVELLPHEVESYALLGEASMELGDYPATREAFGQMEQRGRESVTADTRLARWNLLQGRPGLARDHLGRALLRLLRDPQPSRETVAWCRWQLGETAFSGGDYSVAQRHYEDALTTAPGYFRALASMGRLRGALGDRAGAINFYEQAVRINPTPEFMSAVADLYQVSGKLAEARVRYELVVQLADHSRTVHGQPYNRQLSLFYADHDLRPEEAYTLAKSEYEVRRDIYGADTLSWAALKSGRLAEAKAAIGKALQLGTQDAKLFYHAGMIAQRLGDQAGATEYLRRALALNPQFDLLQAQAARNAAGP